MTIKAFAILCFIIIIALVVFTIKAYAGNTRRIRMWNEISELEKKYDIFVSDKMVEKI